MSAALKTRKINPKRPKVIRRKMKGNERDLLTKEPLLSLAGAEPLADTIAADMRNDENAAGLGELPELENSHSVPDIKVERLEHGLLVVQHIGFVDGKGRPMLEARIRLTTAIAGKRKQDGLTEIAYLLRLEVLTISPAAKIEGLHLGPWQLNELKLETGGVYMAAPLWTAFQPHFGSIRGRIYLGDSKRHRLVDLPLRTEAVIPGPTLFSA